MADCAICLCDEVDCDLPCKHSFHLGCIKAQIECGRRDLANTGAISFGFLSCPICRTDLKIQSLAKDEGFNEMVTLKVMTDSLALKTLPKAIEEIFPQNPKGAALVQKMPRAEKLELAYRKLTFYQCSKCESPYYGGMRDCANEMRQEEEDAKYLKQLIECEEDTSYLSAFSNFFSSLPLIFSFWPFGDGDVNQNEGEVLVLRVEKPPLEPVVNLPEARQQRQQRRERKKKSKREKYKREAKVLKGEEVEKKVVEEKVVEEKQEEVVEEKVVGKNNKECLSCATKKVCDHSLEEMVYKCMKCCSPATYYCLGTEFYCARCHSDLTTLFPCPGRAKCPLKMDHPLNSLGTHGGAIAQRPFLLSCAICGPIRKSYEGDIGSFRVQYS